MSTTTIFREDAEFLRTLRSTLKAGIQVGIVEPACKRLEEIADKLDIFADVSYTPSLQIEGRVEEMLAHNAELWVEQDGPVGGTGAAGGIMAALWLLQRRVK